MISHFFCLNEEITQFHCCNLFIKAYNGARNIMARRSLQSIILNKRLRRHGEKPDGWTFFLLPPLLLAAVFFCCSMAAKDGKRTSGPAAVKKAASDKENE